MTRPWASTCARSPVTRVTVRGTALGAPASALLQDADGTAGTPVEPPAALSASTVAHATVRPMALRKMERDNSSPPMNGGEDSPRWTRGDPSAGVRRHSRPSRASCVVHGVSTRRSPSSAVAAYLRFQVSRCSPYEQCRPGGGACRPSSAARVGAEARRGAVAGCTTVSARPLAGGWTVRGQGEAALQLNTTVTDPAGRPRSPVPRRTLSAPRYVPSAPGEPRRRPRPVPLPMRAAAASRSIEAGRSGLTDEKAHSGSVFMEGGGCRPVAALHASPY